MRVWRNATSLEPWDMEKITSMSIEIRLLVRVTIVKKAEKLQF